MSQDNLLPLRIEKCIAERREPGMMVFNVRPGGGADVTGGNGWIIGVDQSGQSKIRHARSGHLRPSQRQFVVFTYRGWNYPGSHTIRRDRSAMACAREMAEQDPSGGEYRDRHSALASPG